MKRNLRLFMMSLLCAVAGMAWGQSPKVTLDFTSNDWGLPEGSANKATDVAQFSNGTYTISLQATDGYYFNTNGFLMLGKSGSKLTLPAFDFKVGVIAVTGTSGASAAVKQNIFVGDKAVSTETTGAKDVTNNYEIAADHQAAGTVYTLQVTSSHNTQISKIEIYESGAAVKPTPEMSFDPTSITVTLGESVTPPTLSYNGDGAVTYTSSDEAVATVDASTGALSILAAGSTTISANAAETDNYKSAKAQYTLTVKSPAIDDGDDYSITFADLGLDNGVQYLEPFDGGAFTVTFSGGANDGKYYTTGQGVRVYGDGKFSVAAESGNLTKIIITYDGTNKPATNSDITVDPGTYNAETNTWEGKSPIVTFTRPTGNGHWRIQSIKVVIDENSPVEKITPTLAFNPTTLEATLGQNFTEPTLSYNGDGAVSYSISDTKVATVDASSGKLTLVAAGTATVTATAAETNNYKKGTATYALTVKEAGQEEENTIVFADLGLENGVQYTTPFDAGNFTVTFAGGANDGKYYNTGQGIRVYGDGSFTIDSKAGNMIQITITYHDTFKPESADVVSTGTYNPETGVWEGKATSVTFTRPSGNGNWRIQKISVVYEGGEVQRTLTISGTTPFTGSTTVTITPSNEDFIVYYTTDGSNPQPGSGTTKTYSKPFDITETTTVKAVEEDYSEELSAVVEKTFVKNEIASVANIAAFKALDLNTEATLTLNNAQVLWVNNNDVYVRDASGAIDFYQTGLTFTKGQVLNGTITGKYAVYNKIPELAKTEATNASGFKATDGTLTPKKVTIAAAKSETYYCDYIKISGVKVKSVTEDNATNIYAYIGDDEIMLYDRFSVGFGNWNENDTYDVEGILIPYKDYYEIYITAPISADTSLRTYNSIAEFKTLATGTEAILKLNNAQVVYASGNDVYVRDESGAIEFYNLGIEFATNNILNGTITGKYSPYRNLPEIAKTDATNADNLTITEGSEATPKSVTVADLCTETYLNDLVEVTGTISIVDEKTIQLTSGDDKVTVYNKFKIDTAELTDGAKMTIKGIACVFGDTWQILPLSVSKATQSKLKGDADGDGTVNVTDVMCIVDYLLGNMPPKFIFNNANWNGDDKVDITDAMSIVEYILGN